MRNLYLAVALLALPVRALATQGSNGSTPAPYYQRSTQSNQSMGSINANLADITGRNRDKLVGQVGDQDCSLSGGALVGATQKGGYIYGGKCTAIPTQASNTFLPWYGTNYLAWSSSGSVVAFSTGTTSFQVALATMVYRGAIYTAANTAFIIPKSSFSMVSWNPTNGYRQFGLSSFNPSTVSSVTVQIADDIVVAIASTSASGTTFLFQDTQTNPLTVALQVSAGRQSAVLTAGKPPSFWACPTDVFSSCDVGAARSIIVDNGLLGVDIPYMGTSAQLARGIAVVVNNSGTGAATATCQLVTSDDVNNSWVGVNGGSQGGSMTTITVNTPSTQTFSIPTGYSSVQMILNSPSGLFAGSFDCTLPANVSVVRKGYW